MPDFQLPPDFAPGMRQATSRAYSRPYRHWIIDGMHDPDLIRRAAESFPEPWRVAFPWIVMDDEFNGSMRLCSAWGSLPSPFIELLAPLYTAKACQEWGDVTGIKGLKADPQLFNGGMHLMRPGDFLGSHHFFKDMTLIVFLSPWEQDNGGELRLHSLDERDPLSVIQPIQGRTVLLAGKPVSLRSVAPVHAGERKSLVLHFESPEHE